jgi:ABC-type polysaccharide/polyol phosphate export permease
VALWNFFSEGTATGAGSLLSRAELLTKTVLPREVMVYSALLSAGLTFVINLAVLAVLLRITGTPLTLPAITFPLLLIDLVLLTLGTSLFLAPLYVRYRDVGYLWIVWVNPVGRIIGDSRRALIYGWWPGARGLLITTAMSIAVCLLGYRVFRRLQHRLVEHF